MPRKRGEGGGKAVPRNAANARERTRMRVLSKAFGRLKLTLPWVPSDTKLSKLDTLRLAMKYIAHLQEILLADPDTDSPAISQTHALKAWPYGHQKAGLTLAAATCVKCLPVDLELEGTDFNRNSAASPLYEPGCAVYVHHEQYNSKQELGIHHHTSAVVDSMRSTTADSAYREHYPNEF